MVGGFVHKNHVGEGLVPSFLHTFKRQNRSDFDRADIIRPYGVSDITPVFPGTYPAHRA